MKQKPKNGAGLHVFVATGGKPADYTGTKGLNSNTVNNLKQGKKK